MEALVPDPVAHGAVVRSGGRREGAIMDATILERITPKRQSSTIRSKAATWARTDGPRCLSCSNQAPRMIALVAAAVAHATEAEA